MRDLNKHGIYKTKQGVQRLSTDLSNDRNRHLRATTKNKWSKKCI